MGGVAFNGLIRLGPLAVLASVAAACTYTPVQVSPNLEHCTLTVTPASIAGDGVEAAVATVNVGFSDRASAGVVVHIVVADSNNGVAQVSGSTDATGRVTAFLTSRQAGTYPVSAYVMVGGQMLRVDAATPLVVTSSATTPSFSVVPTPANPTAGSAVALSVSALQSNGSPAPGYGGVVQFSSSDPNATLPGAYTFSAGDQGTHVFDAVLKLAGSQTVTVTDTLNSVDRGAAHLLVQPGSPNSIDVIVEPPVATAGGNSTITVTVVDGYGNVDTGYNGTVTVGSDPNFVVNPNPVVITSGQGTATIIWIGTGTQTVTVTDPNGLSGGSQPVTVGQAPVATLHIDMNATVPLNLPTSVVVSAQDAYGNVVPTYTGTVRFSSTDTSAYLPGVYAFQASDLGVHTFVNNATFHQVGTFSLTVQDVNTTSAPAPGVYDIIVVQPVTPYLQVSFASSQASVGVPQGFIVSARDTQNNVLTGYTGFVTFTTGDSRATFATASHTFVTSDQGSFSTSVNFLDTGSYQVKAQDTQTSTMMGISDVVTVGVGPAFTLVTGPVPSTVTAGDLFSLTVTAYDEGGNLVTDYNNTVQFTAAAFNGNVVTAALPPPYTYDPIMDGGVHTFTVQLQTATDQTITVVDESNGAVTGTTSAITVQPATAASFRVGGATSGVAGVAGGNVIVTAYDMFDNTATGYTGTVTFTSTDPNATLPQPYLYAPGDAGSHTFTSVVLYTAAPLQSITATDTTTGITGTQNDIVVQPAGAASIALSGYNSSATAGTAFPLVVTARDPYRNIATGYNGTVHVTSSTDAQALLPGFYSFASGDNGVKTFSVTLNTAGQQSVTVADTNNVTISATTTPIQVVGGVTAKFAVSGVSSPITAGTPATIFVQPLDIHGNASTTYAGTVTFTSSDGNALLPNNFTFTAPNNGNTFSVMLSTTGNQNIVVTDTAVGGISGTQLNISVVPANANSLHFSGYPTTVTSSQNVPVHLTMYDRYGNVATTYGGTVTFSSSDTSATKPGNTTLISGEQNVTFVLVTAGQQRISGVDTVNSALAQQANITVNANGVASLLPNPNVATVPAGTPFSIVVTAKDNAGNVASGYNGTVSLSSPDPLATSTSYTYVPANDAGVHTFAFTLKTANSNAQVRVADTAAGLSTTVIVAVTPLAMSKLVVSGPGAATAGQTPGTFTVTATDTYGNQVSSYLGTITFSSSDHNATLPGNHTFVTGNAGTYSFTNVVFATAGTQTLVATDTSSSVAGSLPGGIAVSAAGATHLSVTGASGGQAPTTTSVVVTAQDGFNNTVLTYGGTVALHSTDANPHASVPSSYTYSATLDNGVHTFAGIVLVTQGTQTINANDTGNPNISGSEAVVIAGGNVASLNVTGYPTSVSAGSANSFTVTAMDPYGNTASNYTGIVTITSTDGSALYVPASYTYRSVDGSTKSFSATFFKAAQNQNLIATDNGGFQGTQRGIVVNPANANHLVVFGVPTNPNAGAPLPVQVQALDAYNNVATGYRGTITFTSSDARATFLPSSYSFMASDAGNHSFSSGALILKTAGNQNVTAVDITNSALNGNQAGIVVSPGNATQVLFITSPTGATTCNTLPTAVQVAVEDTYGNYVASPTAVTLSLYNNTAGGTLKGTLTQNSNNGVATFGDLSVNLAGTYTLLASAPGPITAFSPFSVAPVPPTVTVNSITGSSGNITIGYTVTDVCSAPATVSVQYSVGSGAYVQATQAASSNGNGLYNLPTSRSGTPLEFIWNSASPNNIFRANETNVSILITATTQDGNGSGPATTSVFNGVQMNHNTIASSGATCLAIADPNHDAKADILACGSAAVNVLSGQGNYVFLQTGTPSVSSPSAVATADLNFDGHDDFVVANANGVAVYKSQGSGTSWATAPNVGSGQQNAVALADISHDGKMDIIMAGTGFVGRALGQGNGLFATVSSSTVPVTNVVALAVADFTKDGNSEIALADNGNNQIIILTSSFSGTLSFMNSLPANGVNDVAVADFNRDGNNDILYSQTGSYTVAFGDGGGNFPTLRSTTCSGCLRVKVGDFDGDAIPDVAALTGSGVIISTGDGTGMFNPAYTFSFSASGGLALAVADLNHDAKQDIVVGTTSSVIVLENTRPSLTWDPGGAYSYYIDAGLAGSAIGDFNHDGKYDVAVASTSSGIVHIWYGDGAGGLTVSSNALTVSGAKTPAVLDLNGDNYTDLVVPSTTGNTVSVCLNTNGLLGTPSAYSTGSGTAPVQAAVGDVSGDGIPDVVTADSGSANVSVLLGTSTGTLHTPATLIPVGAPTTAVVVGDFDGNGYLDIAAASQNANIYVLFNNGHNSFGSYQSYNTSGIPSGLAVGDFNGDKLPDLATAANGNVDTFLNSHTGFNRTVVPAAAGAPVATLVVDVTGDSNVDIVSVVQSSNTLVVNPGLGNGSFSTTATTYATDLAPFQVVGGDLTGDGMTDLVVANRLDPNIAQQTVTVFRSQVGGFITPTRNANTTLGLIAVGTADYNLDGIPDAAVASTNPANSNVYVLLGDGKGALETTGTPTLIPQGTDLITTDINMDGWPDFIVGSTTTTMTIFTNKGAAGSFQTSTYTQPNSNGTGRLTAADLNHDGSPDLIAPLAQSSSMIVANGSSNGSFGSPVTHTCSGQTGALGSAAGDVNNDGFLDVAMAYSGSNYIGIYLGTATGPASNCNVTLSVGTAATPRFASLVDLNWDGWLDMVVINNWSTANAVQVYLNGGGGLFTAPVSYAVNGPAGVALVDSQAFGSTADVNNDGNIDVLVGTWKYNNTVAILLGNGNGTLSTTPIYMVAYRSTTEPVSVDLNRDGIQDMVAASQAAVSAIDVFLGR